MEADRKRELAGQQEKFRSMPSVDDTPPDGDRGAWDDANATCDTRN